MKVAALGNYIPTSVKRRNVLFVALDGAIIGLMSAAGTFVSVLVVRLGASALWVSLLSSIPAAVRLVMAIPWARFAEQQTKPQSVFAWARLAVHVVYPLVAVVPFFLQGEAAAIAIVIIWSLLAVTGSLSDMMFTIVMGQAVAPDRRAFMMSRRWTMLGIAKLVSIPIASQLIARMVFPSGYQVVFGANVVFALLALGTISQLRIQERQVIRRPRGRGLRDQIQQSLIEIWSEKPFVIFVSGWAIFNLGLALVSAMIPIFWVSYLLAPDSWIGTFNTTLSAATLVSYTPWVRWKRKLGTWKMLVIAVFGSALYPALLALTRSPVAVLPVIAFNGLAGGGVNLAVFDALLEICPRDKQERFIAINMTAVNLMGVIGPPIGAALFGVLSIQWVMAIGTIISLAGAAIFVVARAGVRRPPAAVLDTSPIEASQE